MPERTNSSPTLPQTIREWWANNVSRYGFWPTLKMFVSEICYFVRDSTPARQRQRYGDIDYDWEHRVDTTSATVSFRDRLIGTFHSLYQATEAASFREMMNALPIAFNQFTFIDLGSGKGRTLLMASDFPLQNILGVELLPELHRVAEENLLKYHSDSQKCFALASVCGNARDFVFPPVPLVVYLFNPFPESTLEQVLRNLENSLTKTPRDAYLVYYNPLLEAVLAQGNLLRKVGGGTHYVIYAYAPQLTS
jgi:hypothetical protein